MGLTGLMEVTARLVQRGLDFRRVAPPGRSQNDWVADVRGVVSRCPTDIVGTD
jgi:hypothetical protein